MTSKSSKALAFSQRVVDLIEILEPELRRMGNLCLKCDIQVIEQLSTPGVTIVVSHLGQTIAPVFITITKVEFLQAFNIFDFITTKVTSTAADLHSQIINNFVVSSSELLESPVVFEKGESILPKIGDLLGKSEEEIEAAKKILGEKKK